MYPFSKYCVVISLLATQGELKGLCNIALKKSVTEKKKTEFNEICNRKAVKLRRNRAKNESKFHWSKQMTVFLFGVLADISGHRFFSLAKLNLGKLRDQLLYFRAWVKIVLLNFLVSFIYIHRRKEMMNVELTFHCCSSRRADFAWLAARSLSRLDFDKTFFENS